jgi:hypothetical protein
MPTLASDPPPHLTHSSLQPHLRPRGDRHWLPTRPQRHLRETEARVGSELCPKKLASASEFIGALKFSVLLFEIPDPPGLSRTDTRCMPVVDIGCRAHDRTDSTQ